MDDTTFASPEKMASFLLESSQEIADLLQSLSHEKRIEILANLVFGRQSFAELQEQTGFQASVLGNHLVSLSEAGLTRKIRRGMYDITPEGIDFLQKISEGYLALKIREQQRLEHLKSMIGRYTSGFEKLKSKGEIMTKTKNEISVRIVELPPFRYASFHAMGTSPEGVALDKLKSWAEPKGYMNDLATHPIYGFNNPDPKKGDAEYGYEFWIVVGEDVASDNKVKIKEYSGGRFAVTTTMLFPLSPDNVIPAWPSLVEWVKDNNYTTGTHQYLEKALTPNAEGKDVMLDLYLPIE